MEWVPSRHRVIIICALFAVTAGCWAYLLMGAGTGMSTIGMTSWRMALGLRNSRAMPVDWSAEYAMAMFIMWWIMMIAMMLPSAAPVILVHAMADRTARAGGPAYASMAGTAAFLAGYLLAWGAFSAIATAMQWAFESTGLLSPGMMNSTNAIFSGSILLFAGAYQLTPIKQACLKPCRAPERFVAQSWQPGNWGAFQMGLKNGVHCLASCWGLMAILFFGGIMNLYWIIGLALLVLVEKTMPQGVVTSYLTGGILATWGAIMIILAMA